MDVMENAEGTEQAEVPATQAVTDARLEEEALDAAPTESELLLGPAAARLPVELDISIMVHNFRVHNLLSLEPGVVIETRWSHGQDLPLCAKRIQLAWVEFEVLDADLAVRITHLA